jgi:rRNA-processing protein FCF1
MAVNVEDLVRRHASKGVIVDTNILVLFIVGCFDPQRIPRFKRTCQFQVTDFNLLVQLLASFHRRVTTPSILAETSNHVSQLGEPARGQCLRKLAEIIGKLEERYVASAELAIEDTFPLIGLTDTSIQRAAKDGLLVLTDDLTLANRLASRGMAAINFNHIRAWQ